jgi:hypothetical protein
MMMMMVIMMSGLLYAKILNLSSLCPLAGGKIFGASVQKFLLMQPKRKLILGISFLWQSMNLTVFVKVNLYVHSGSQLMRP